MHYVQHMLGHASLQQTSTYRNATLRGLHESMRNLDQSRRLPACKHTRPPLPACSQAGSRQKREVPSLLTVVVGGVSGTSFATGWLRQKPDVPLCDPVQHDACAIQIRGERRNGRVFGARDGYFAVASPGRKRFSRNVKEDLRSPASRARKRLPSGVTAYCGRFADGLTRVGNNGEGCRATSSRPDSTPTLIMVPSSAR